VLSLGRPPSVHRKQRDRLVTANELAKLLGVVPDTFRRWAHLGKMRGFQPNGRKWVFLDDWKVDTPPAPLVPRFTGRRNREYAERLERLRTRLTARRRRR
jgi:excisionase family DNA binding protein